MKKLITLVLLTVLIPATSFAAQPVNTYIMAKISTVFIMCGEQQELYIDVVTATDKCNSNSYLGYLMGVNDIHQQYVSWGMPPKFCMPRDITVERLSKIVVDYVTKKNEQRENIGNYGAGGQISTAFYRAFPTSLKDDGTRYCP